MSAVVARASRLLTGRGGRGTGDSTRKPPDAAAILGAMPVPVVLLDVENRFRHVNNAAEQFLGISAAGLAQLRLEDLLPHDNPLFRLIEQVRDTEATISDHDLNLDSPRLHKRGITVQGSPLPEEPGSVLLVMQDASAARSLDRQLAFRCAARFSPHAPGSPPAA
jgi:two-component system nitrogen regulation sensor histidine kinase GlnL